MAKKTKQLVIVTIHAEFEHDVFEDAKEDIRVANGYLRNHGTVNAIIAQIPPSEQIIKIDLTADWC